MCVYIYIYIFIYIHSHTQIYIYKLLAVKKFIDKFEVQQDDSLRKFSLQHIYCYGNIKFACFESYQVGLVIKKKSFSLLNSLISVNKKI